jgi:hypothetical protein
MRAILGAYHSGGFGLALRANSSTIRVPRRTAAPDTPATIDAIRQQYDEQLIALGFQEASAAHDLLPSRQSVLRRPLGLPARSALELWNKTNPPPEDPQLSSSSTTDVASQLKSQGSVGLSRDL